MTQKKGSAISEMFDIVAPNYDIMNWCMSCGLHTLWNRTLTKRLVKNASHSDTFLDLCCGTGDILSRYAHAFRKAKGTTPSMTGVDFSQGMLEVAEKRLAALSLTLLKADVTCLPLEENRYATVSVAYGVRNIQERRAFFQEVFRVMKPGGIFAILELTRPSKLLLKNMHAFYLNNIIPLIAAAFAPSSSPYHYLSETIQRFVEPTTLSSELRQHGFSEVEVLPLTFGISTIITCKKPSIAK